MWIYLSSSGCVGIERNTEFVDLTLLEAFSIVIFCLPLIHDDLNEEILRKAIFIVIFAINIHYHQKISKTQELVQNTSLNFQTLPGPILV